MRMEEIKVGKADRRKAEAFADARVNENQALYQARGGFKRDDILTGALAELAAYKLLRSYGFKISRPDFKIYERGQKSFDADLQSETKKFHVKGQTKKSAKIYGNSWLMQRSDPLVKGAQLNNYIIPTEVCLETNTVKIFGITSFTALHNFGCFGDCKLERFNRTKTAIYLESINFLSNKAKWGILYK